MSDVKHRPRLAPMFPALIEVLRASDGILDLLPIATFITDAKGVILQYNCHATELWGERRGLARPTTTSSKALNSGSRTAHR